MELTSFKQADPGESAASPSDEREPRLKILHIINTLGLGGAEAILYRVVTRDEANDHSVISLGSPCWYSASLLAKGVPLDHLDIDSALATPIVMVRLNRLIRESGADVVQCWMYRSNVAGGLAAKLAGKPVIWGIHCSSLEPLRLASRALARLGGVLAKWTPDFVINCSTRSAELHRKLGYSAAPGAVVHNGYDSSIWYPDEAIRCATRDALGFAADDFVVGSIARWHAQKDIPNLLRASKLAHDRGVPLRCLLVGAGLGADNASLMQEIERAGCSEFVLPLGSRSDVGNLARALDLHVLASCGAEAFPNVVAETMLSGTLNVVTDVGDSAFIVGDTGRVVPPRDPEQLADAIVEAYRDRSERPDEWAARGQAARARASDNFSFDRMLEDYRHIWRKVAKRHAR